MLPFMSPIMLPCKETNVTIVWGSYEDVTNYGTIHVTIENKTMLPSLGRRMRTLPFMLPFMLPWRKNDVTIVWGSYGDVTIHVTIHVTSHVTIHVTIHVTMEKNQCYHRLGYV